jgi:hypothetical protein
MYHVCATLSFKKDESFLERDSEDGCFQIQNIWLHISEDSDIHWFVFHDNQNVQYKMWREINAI